MSITTQTPEEIAELAATATKDWPTFTPEDKFVAMLTYINDGQDDLEAAVIAACRKKAGLS